MNLKAIDLGFLLALSAWSAGAAAQAPAPKGPANCRVSLPYVDGAFSDCTPQVAAAYDFAFCSTTYHIIALSAPESDRALGEQSQSASYQRKSEYYAMVAVALSSAEALQKNVGLAQKYYESLNGKERVYVSLTIDTIGLKCDAVEEHHSGALEAFPRTVQSPPKVER